MRVIQALKETEVGGFFFMSIAKKAKSLRGKSFIKQTKAKHYNEQSCKIYK